MFLLLKTWLPLEKNKLNFNKSLKAQNVKEMHYSLCIESTVSSSLWNLIISKSRMIGKHMKLLTFLDDEICNDWGQIHIVYIYYHYFLHSKDYLCSFEKILIINKSWSCEPIWSALNLYRAICVVMEIICIFTEHLVGR